MESVPPANQLLPSNSQSFSAPVHVLTQSDQMGAGEAKDVNWQLARTPGPMKCVSVGGDNVWAIDLQNQIWRLCIEDLLDFNWKRQDGAATYISGTEGGSAWCINSQDEIHEWYKGWTSNRWEKRPGALRMVSIGKKEHIWGINGNQEIWKWNYTTKNWDKMPGSAVHLSVGRDGTCWCVNSMDEIYRWTGTAWTLVEGKLMNISDLVRFGDGAKAKFQGGLKHVSVGKAGYHHIWGVNEQGQVWFHRSTSDQQALERRRANANPTAHPAPAPQVHHPPPSTTKVSSVTITPGGTTVTHHHVKVAEPSYNPAFAGQPAHHPGFVPGPTVYAGVTPGYAPPPGFNPGPPQGYPAQPGFAPPPGYGAGYPSAPGYAQPAYPPAGYAAYPGQPSYPPPGM